MKVFYLELWLFRFTIIYLQRLFLWIGSHVEWRFLFRRKVTYMCWVFGAEQLKKRFLCT